MKKIIKKNNGNLLKYYLNFFGKVQSTHYIWKVKFSFLWVPTRFQYFCQVFQTGIGIAAVGEKAEISLGSETRSRNIQKGRSNGKSDSDKQIEVRPNDKNCSEDTEVGNEGESKVTENMPRGGVRS